MLKVLNIGRDRTRGGTVRKNRATVGRPTHSEAVRDYTEAIRVRNWAFLA